MKFPFANAQSHVHVGEGTVKSLKWRSVFTKARYSAHCSSSLCLKHCHALSCKFRSRVPWEDLYADDLFIITESLEECVRRLLTWREAMEEKGLRVNAGKTKICGIGLDLLQSSSEFPCAVCHTVVGSNSILCNSCKHWVHKKGSGLKGLTKDPDYRCTRCQTSNVCRGLTGQWSDRSAMSGHKTLSPPDPMSYLHGLALKIWTSFWRREGSSGMDMWNTPMVQSRQLLTYKLMESIGLGGPRWHGNSWQRGIAESGSSRLSTLMIYLETWCEICDACSKPATWKGAADVAVAPVPAH